jgi:hypothetical protein
MRTECPNGSKAATAAKDRDGWKSDGRHIA